MEIELHDEKRGSIYLASHVPGTLSSQLLSNAVPFAIDQPGHTALFQLLPGDGFSIWYSIYQNGPERTILRARSDQPVLELRIAIKNQIKGTWDKFLEPALPEYHFNLSFTPFVLTRAIFEPNTEYISLDFHFELSFLEDLGVDFKAMDIFLNKIHHEQPAELSPHPHACPSEMKDAVRAILYNKYSHPGKSLLNKWKAGEILLSALETVGRTESLLPLPLRPDDIRKLQHARAVIQDKYPDWIGHKAICQQSQLNQLKLKIGFKHLFHQTPYEFFLELKLREARQYLLEGKETIASIAYLTGYKHASSFSRSFKEVYGYSPKEFLKEGKY